ncbi:glycerophosphodiester phosphodiesterase [Corynebacterium intestinale]|uniref:glycerophosphodiester phosphodiesterase n=1 Tax=Corynebacterium intestinale TaxID=2943492 RepID=UPI0034628931
MSECPRIIAHRGYNGWYPENTFRSFEEALKLDVAGVECDVNLTKDGEVVVIHDQTVDRTSNGAGAVGDMTLEELRTLNFGTHGIRNASCFSTNSWTSSCHTLESSCS